MDNSEIIENVFQDNLPYSSSSLGGTGYVWAPKS